MTCDEWTNNLRVSGGLRCWGCSGVSLQYIYYAVDNIIMYNNGFNIIIWKNIKGCSFPTINSNDYSSYEVMKLTQYFMGV